MEEHGEGVTYLLNENILYLLREEINLYTMKSLKLPILEKKIRKNNKTKKFPEKKPRCHKYHYHAN